MPELPHWLIFQELIRFSIVFTPIRPVAHHGTFCWSDKILYKIIKIRNLDMIAGSKWKGR
jgi:hypothetical protein